MATISLPEDTYRRIAAKAASLSMTLEDFLTSLSYDSLAEDKAVLNGQDWFTAFEALHQQAVDRKHLYPAGFQVDDSRDTIYNERINTQIK